ncbi:MAG: AbrB/MazE/SpoVT family DNA-binding domain-containing protein [Lachnospiraceae bacterium]|nr:AbrB/MazE/SpoVT family DNA-binding domain-containing protein [Lachnospiraceae bacterium]
MKAVTTHITKPFMSGRSQAIRIPKEYQIEDTEVIINRVGDSLIITPKAALNETFFDGLSMISDDFLAEGRPEEVPNNRVEL